MGGIWRLNKEERLPRRKPCVSFTGSSPVLTSKFYYVVSPEPLQDNSGGCFDFDAVLTQRVIVQASSQDEAHKTACRRGPPESIFSPVRCLAAQYFS